MQFSMHEMDRRMQARSGVLLVAPARRRSRTSGGLRRRARPSSLRPQPRPRSARTCCPRDRSGIRRRLSCGGAGLWVRRGPAPTPTKLKRLRGETHPSRLNLAEPLPVAEVPMMPPDMDADAKGVWPRLIRDMRHAGVIRAADVLRRYCEPVSRYAAAARLYAQSGRIVRGRHGGELVKKPPAKSPATTPRNRPTPSPSPSGSAAASRRCGWLAGVYSDSGPSTLTTGAPGPIRTSATSAGWSGSVPSRWINPRGTCA